MIRNRISIRDAIDFAWTTYKKRYGLFIATLLTMFAAWAVLEVLVFAGQRFGIVPWIVLHAAFLIFFAGLELGLLRVALALFNREKPQFRDVFAGLGSGVVFLAAQVFFALMVVTGLALVIVPGLYLGARYGLFGFALATGETNIIDSFQRSATLSADSVGTLMLAFAGLLVFNVLGACVLGLGLLITVPLSILMMTAIYRQLSPS